MKKMILPLLLIALSLPVFAGAYVDTSNYAPRKISLKNPAPVADPVVKEIIREKTIEKLVEKPKPAPALGWFGGFNGMTPTLGYAGTDCDLEIGYAKIDGDQIGLVKAGAILSQSADAYRKVKFLVAVYPGNQSGVATGFGVGIEQYLDPALSISGDIYPIRFGNGHDHLGDVQIGARLYF